MKHLFLKDLSGLTEEQIAEHLVEQYGAERKDVDRFDILIAYESVGSWGCDSSSWFLLQERKTKKLFETHGSHCSCYGFEGQWCPELTTKKYLQSDKFYLLTGGYDSNDNENRKAVKDFIAGL